MFAVDQNSSLIQEEQVPVNPANESNSNIKALHRSSAGNKSDSTSFIQYPLYFSSPMAQLNAISVPKKVHRPEIINDHKSKSFYPDVNACHFLHKLFGKTLFRPKNWDATQRDNFISFDTYKHKNALDSLNAGIYVTSSIWAKVISFKNYWYVFAPEGSCRHILGYNFRVDTGISASV